MKDALIIGQGIAGTVISYELIKRGWSVDVIDKYKPLTASKIASGLYNPLVLKRRRVVWQAPIMLEHVLNTYRGMEELTGRSFLQHKPVWEVLPDPGTENDWANLADQPKFADMIGDIKKVVNPHIRAKSIGEVAGSGKVDVEEMILAWSEYLSTQNSHYDTYVKPSEIVETTDGWKWKENIYKHVFWCEGYSQDNPFFPPLPFSPTKGEVMIVKASDLKLEHILHGNMFIMPLGEDRYKVGATYAWDALDDKPSQEGLEKLTEAWEKLVDCKFEVEEHLAGVRPNVKDRKPLIGTSPKHSRIHLFNGMGSRGILMAPWLAKRLVDQIIDGTPIPPETDLNRFSG